MEIYAGRVVCCPLVSLGKYVPSALLSLKKDGTDRHTDGLTDARPLHYTLTDRRGQSIY